MKDLGANERRGDGSLAQDLEAARAGKTQRLGQALEACRGYLQLLADGQLGPDLASKVASSDLVQETFLAARRDFASFRGRTPEEFRGWLRGVLLHLAANTRRHYRTQAHSAAREVSLEGDGSHGIAGKLADSVTSPSQGAMRHEESRTVLEALEQLPLHYRSVIEWHHRDQLTFEEIAVRLRISPEAARKLWGRALSRLRKTLGPHYEP